MRSTVSDRRICPEVATFQVKLTHDSDASTAGRSFGRLRLLRDEPIPDIVFDNVVARAGAVQAVQFAEVCAQSVFRSSLCALQNQREQHVRCFRVSEKATLSRCAFSQHSMHVAVGRALPHIPTPMIKRGALMLEARRGIRGDCKTFLLGLVRDVEAETIVPKLRKTSRVTVVSDRPIFFEACGLLRL